MRSGKRGLSPELKKCPPDTFLPAFGGPLSSSPITRPDECRDAQQHLEARELAQSLNGFLATLSPRDRQLFLSRYYYAMTAPQLAKKYGGSPRQIKYRLQKLRGELKAHLEKEGIYV